MKSLGKITFIAVFALLIASAFIPVSSSYLPEKKDYKSQGASAIKIISKPETETKFSFNSQFLEAKSALVMRFSDQKIIFEKESRSQQPLASLAKLMTAYTVEKIKGRHEAIDIIVPIGNSALVQEGDSGLQLGETFSSSVLRDIMLIGSSNDSAYALAEGLASSVEEFVLAMNENANNLGLEKTRFFNPTGLDLDKENAGALGSAFDLSKLVLAILKDYPRIFEITAEPQADFVSEEGFSHKIINTNHLVSEIPGVIASKTGYSDLAGANLLMLIDMGFNDPYLFIVLGSSYEGRFEDMKKLHETVKNSFILK